MFYVHMLTELAAVRIARFPTFDEAEDFADRQPFSTLIEWRDL